MYYRKRNKSGIIAMSVVIIACLIAIAYVLWPKEPNVDNDITADNQVSTEDQWNNEDTTGNISNEHGNNENTGDNQQDQNIMEETNSYYLLRNDNGVINIYFCDGKGSETFLESTDILYEVLSENDQASFNEGYKVESRDQLFNILQDYES